MVPARCIKVGEAVAYGEFLQRGLPRAEIPTVRVLGCTCPAICEFYI